MAVKIRTGAKWLSLSILAAVISAAVGGAGGMVGAKLWDAYVKLQETEVYTIGEDDGIAHPDELFNKASEDGLQITFRPPNLQKVVVCEYFFDYARDWRQLALNYLKEYSDCFIVRRLSAMEIEVLPDTRASSLLRHDPKNDAYFCKCPSQ